MPGDMLLTSGITAHKPLNTKLATTAYSTFLSRLDGGTMMAMNIPYNETLSADTIFAGSIPPATIPVAQPDAQNNVDMNAAEYVYAGGVCPSWFIDMPNTSSVIHKAISSLFSIEVPGAIFCDNAALISR